MLTITALRYQVKLDTSDTAAGKQAECFHTSQDLMRMKIIAE